MWGLGLDFSFWVQVFGFLFLTFGLGFGLQVLDGGFWDLVLGI